MSDLKKYPKTVEILTNYVESAYSLHRGKDVEFYLLSLKAQHEVLAKLYDETDPATRYYLIPLEDETFHAQLNNFLNSYSSFDPEKIKNSILSEIREFHWDWICEATDEIQRNIQQRKAESFLEYCPENFSQGNYTKNILEAMKLI